jgi:hypothetical protein
MEISVPDSLPIEYNHVIIPTFVRLMLEFLEQKNLEHPSVLCCEEENVSLYWDSHFSISLTPTTICVENDAKKKLPIPNFLDFFDYLKSKLKFGKNVYS